MNNNFGTGNDIASLLANNQIVTLQQLPNSTYITVNVQQPNSPTNNPGSPQFLPFAIQLSQLLLKPTGVQELGRLIGFDMNALETDQPITLTGGTKFVVTDIVITNASISLTTADDFEAWTQAGASGKQIAYTNGSALSHLVTPTDMLNGNIRQTTNYRNYLNMNPGFSTCGTTLYTRIGIGQGSTATADVYVYGYILS